MHTETYFKQTEEIAGKIDYHAIEKVADRLRIIRENRGRLFIIGVGGSAANCSHAVNDFRKLCAIDAYAPTDNVSELTARTNDDGWDSVFSEWLKISQINNKDGILVFSVGGGNREKNVSVNLISAIDLAKSAGAAVLAIVGRDGGYAAGAADATVIVPTVDPRHVTPHTEAFQAVVWHSLVSNPKLQVQETKW